MSWQVLATGLVLGGTSSFVSAEKHAGIPECKFWCCCGLFRGGSQFPEHSPVLKLARHQAGVGDSENSSTQVKTQQITVN